MLGNTSGKLRAFSYLLSSLKTFVVLIRDGEGCCLKIAPTNPINLVKPLANMLGKMLHEVMPLAQADLILAHIRTALESQQSVYYEYNLRASDREV